MKWEFFQNFMQKRAKSILSDSSKHQLDIIVLTMRQKNPAIWTNGDFFHQSRKNIAYGITRNAKINPWNKFAHTEPG
jgi:hypothetical protein